MNEQQEAELRAMRDEQRTLRQRLGALDERLGRFESRAAEEVVAALPVMAKQPVVAAPPPLPPPLPVVAVSEPVRPALSLADIAADAGWRATKTPAAAVEAAPGGALPVLPPVVPPTTQQAAAPAAEHKSLEMQIGMVWLVRAGVLAALTALVFLGSALYQNVVPHLGPAAKVALLYLGAGALTGAGVWLERSRQSRDNGRLRNFARVIFAGGLAGIYYVTYAAHYVERLRMVDSALVAGALLLAWTAFMVWLAHRRQSETLATVSILLAYYTSAINDGVAGFTLFSNLALTGGTVFLLRRHLWRVFPFVSVLATFGSYAYWTYHASLLTWQGLGTPPMPAHHGPGGFWIEAAFLAVYWALFTWAAFTAAEGVLPSLRRAGFVSLNNGAFFGLTTWLVLGQEHDWFWRWSLGFGVVLWMLAELCRRLPRPADPKTEDAYLLQGILLVTTGFVAYFEGWQLSVVLAVQAVALCASAGRRSSALLLGSALLTALLAFGWSVHAFEAKLEHGEWLTPLAVGGFLTGAAYLAQRMGEQAEGTEPIARGAFRRLLGPAPTYFSLLGCVVWFVLIGDRVPGTDSGILLFIGAAILLTASVYVLRVKALAIYAQAFLAAGSLIWASETLFHFTPMSGPNVWTTLGPLTGALALGHWWDQLPAGARWTRGGLSRTISALDAVLSVGVVFAWFIGHHWSETPDQHGKLAAGLSGLALAVFAYAAVTRYRALGVTSQILLLAGVGAFFELAGHTWSGGVWEIAWAAVPCLAVLAMLTGARYLLPPERWTPGFQTWAGLYEGLAMLIFLVWGGRYLPPTTLMPVFVLAGTAVFALGVERHMWRWMILSAVPTLVGVCCFLAEAGGNRATIPSVIGILLLAGQQQIGKRRLGIRLPGWFPAFWQNSVMILATLCAWVFVSDLAGRWHGSSFTLAASWSVFAAVIFAAGLFLLERIYRWLGLLVMGVTFGHLAIFDIMQLDSLGKAVSFFALAVVLVTVGFVYNKYQAKFRDLL